MAQAIAEAKRLGDSAKLRTIARAWDVPKSTLQRRLKGHVMGAQHCSGRKPVFSQPSIYIDGWLYAMSMTSVVCNVPVLSQNDSTYHHSVFTT